MNDQSLSQQLFSELQGEPLRQIAQTLGTDTTQAGSAVSQALPLIMGALGHHATQDNGGGGQVAALMGALGNGSSGLGNLVGGLVGGLLGGNAPSTSPAASNTSPEPDTDSLTNLFGRQGAARATEGLGQSSGLGTQNAGKLLGLLLPFVIAFLGKRFLQGGGGNQQLNQALVNEHQELKSSGGLGNLLDQNGDGKLDMGDLVSLGSSLFGGKR